VEKAGNKQALQEMDRALEEFVRCAPAYGVEPTPLQMAQVRIYVTELLRWNEKINLTAARHPKEVLLHHVLDSLVPLAHLDDLNALLDVGSGAGFPGIPMKLFRPELFVVLLEARRKKASFNQHVVDRLGAEGLEVVWGRLGERGVERRYAGRPFDGVVTRAALSPGRILQTGSPLLRPGGKVILMVGTIDRVGRQALDEEALRHGRASVRVVPYRLPGLERTRNLVLIC
jgi:16S rRNA (guanine527-N7)-methyltransferase